AKEARMDKSKQALLAAVEAAREVLDAGRPLSAEPSIDRVLLRELFLLTAKPFLYVFNVDEDVLSDDAKHKELIDLVAPADAVVLCAKVEAELLELPEEDAAELLASLGQSESGLAALARIGFHTLGLQTYLTAGPKESRAWTIRKGACAPEAAGVIHTDFQRGFIKAEVTAFDDFVKFRGEAGARDAGKLRLEGK